MRERGSSALEEQLPFLLLNMSRTSSEHKKLMKTQKHKINTTTRKHTHTHIRHTHAHGLIDADVHVTHMRMYVCMRVCVSV